MADIKKIIVKGESFSYTGDKQDFTKAMYSWTKWGGGNRGLYHGALQDEWTCQACGQKQVKELPPYMFEFVPREYLSICAICQFTTTKFKITIFYELVELVRLNGSYDVEFE